MTKLLDKKSAISQAKKDNDELIESNIRLRKYYADIVQKLNVLKDNYEPDKIQKLKEFEQFSIDLSQKRMKLLEEFAQVSKLVDQKKEQYYAMIEKQDLLEEKIYQVAEAHKKLDLRESFINTLEANWKEKSGLSS